MVRSSAFTSQCSEGGAHGYKQLVIEVDDPGDAPARTRVQKAIGLP